jgi:hypothetical protein
MDYDARNLLHTNRSHVLLKSASSVPAAFQLTGEVLFNKKKIEVDPYVCKQQENPQENPRKGKPAFRWGWYYNVSSSVNDIKLRFPRMAPSRGTFEPFREGRHVIFTNLPDQLRGLDGSAFN